MRGRLWIVLPLCAAPMLAWSQTPGPAPRQTETLSRRAALDRLLDALKSAASEQEAAALEARIQHSWIEQASPAVMLLIARGARNLDAGANQDAIEDFDAAIALDPGVAELWHRRAIAKFALGDTRGAIRDLEETLKREPRHFAAFRTLARIAESRQDWKGAYAAWQKLLDIDPKTPGGAEKLKDLRRRALGEAA